MVWPTTLKTLEKRQEHLEIHGIIIQRSHPWWTQECDLQRHKCLDVPHFCVRFDCLLNKSRKHVPNFNEILHVHILWDLGPLPSGFTFPALFLQLRCHKHQGPLGPVAELLVILLRAEIGAVFAPSRRKACKHWKTGPPAGWLFAPSRPTPKATESWRQGEAGKGYAGMWQSVLSACRRGELAQLRAGTDTAEGCKKQSSKEEINLFPFLFSIGICQNKNPQAVFNSRVHSCQHARLYAPSPVYQTYWGVYFTCSRRLGWAAGLHQESETIQTNRCR